MNGNYKITVNSNFVLTNGVSYPKNAFKVNDNNGLFIDVYNIFTNDLIFSTDWNNLRDSTNTAYADKAAALTDLRTSYTAGGGGGGGSSAPGLAGTLWEDASGNFFVRRDIVSTSGTYSVVWTDSSGTIVATPTGVKPAATSRELVTLVFDATVPGTGYIANDVLMLVKIIDVNTQAVLASLWLNITQNTTLAGPPTSGTFIQSNENIQVTDANLGSQTDAVATTDTGTFSVIAFIKRALQNWTTLLSRIPNPFPAGFMRTSDEPKQVFYDPFDGVLDTTNLWATPTTGNAAVAASATNGIMTMGTGTTASGWSKLVSSPSFKLTVPAWLGFSSAVALPDGAAPIANSYRYWGSGTTPGTPTTGTPVTDGVGFEMTTAGKLFAVVYAGGVRTAVADLSAVQPTDALAHRYICYVRTDRVYWYIDSLATPVATSNFQSPNIQTLPALFLTIGGATPPVSNVQLQVLGTAVWDTGKNTSQISDGTYPWRKAKVDASGNLSTSSPQIDNTSIFIGTLSAVGPSVTIDTTGYKTLVIQVLGTWNGIINIEGNNDLGTQYLPLTSVNTDRSSIYENIINNGVFVLKTTTKYARLNLVQLLGGNVLVNIIGRTVAEIDPSDSISYAMDWNNKMPLYVAETLTKKDINNALMLSDGIQIPIFGAISTPIIIDTLGYQSMNITTQGMAANITASDDGITFGALTGTSRILGPYITAVTALAGFSFPCIARYIKILPTTMGTATVSLRNSPWIAGYTTTPMVAGAAGVNGGVAGTSAIGGNVAHSSPATANPVIFGGVVFPATPDLTLAAGDVSRVGITAAMQLVVKRNAPAEYETPIVGKLDSAAGTTPLTLRSAAGAGLKHSIVGIQLSSDALLAASTLVIKDSAITIASQTPSSNTFTSSAAHGLIVGDAVIFTAYTSLTGATAQTMYWVLTVPSGTTFTLGSQPGGGALTIGGTGTASLNRILWQCRLQAASMTTVAYPFDASPLRSALANGTLDIQILANTTGSIYYTLQTFTAP